MNLPILLTIMKAMRKSKKERIFEIIQIGNREDLPSYSFDIFLVVVILANIICMFLETFDEFQSGRAVFRLIETVTVIIFMLEYILRIWTAQYLYPELSKGRAKLRFLYSFDGIIELLTILPFFFLSGFVAFRMLRVVRIFHLFRLNTQYDSFNVITSVLYEKRNQILSSVFIILILMLASSLSMYSAEHEAQPEVFSNAFSGIWWSMATLLTVGYGDIYPITIVGKSMAIVIAFLGVGVVAIPTGIISAGFVEQYQKTMHADQAVHDIAKIGEILVKDKSEYIGKTIGELVDEYNLRVYMVIRGELNLIATDNLLVAEHDILIVETERMRKKNGRN